MKALTNFLFLKSGSVTFSFNFKAAVFLFILFYCLASEGLLAGSELDSRGEKIFYGKRKVDYIFSDDISIRIYVGNKIYPGFDFSGDIFNRVPLVKSERRALDQPDMNVYYVVLKDGDGFFNSIKIYAVNTSGTKYKFSHTFLYPTCEFYGNSSSEIKMLNVYSDVKYEFIKTFVEPTNYRYGVSSEVDVGEGLVYEFNSSDIFDFQNSLQSGLVKNFVISCGYYVETGVPSVKSARELNFAIEIPELKIKLKDDTKRINARKYVDDVLVPAIESIPDEPNRIKERSLLR